MMVVGNQNPFLANNRTTILRVRVLLALWLALVHLAFATTIAAAATTTTTTTAAGASATTTTCKNNDANGVVGGDDSISTTCDNTTNATTVLSTTTTGANSSSSSSLAASSNSASACTIVEIMGTEWPWIVAGHGVNRGDALGQPDVVVPFRIYNRHTTWPLWRRHHYFWPLQQLDHETNSDSDDKDLLVFAPGLGSHLSCHDRLHNVRYNVSTFTSIAAAAASAENKKPYSTYTSEPLTASRMIARNDPLAIPCRDQDLVAQAKYTIQDVHDFHYSNTNMNSSNHDKDEEDEDEDEDEWQTFCWQPLVVGPSTIIDIGKGAFSTGHYEPGDIVTHVPMIHLHRHELRQNSTHDPYELLLNYAHGHAHSPLLLLPNSPVVNYINHASYGDDDDDDEDDEQDDHAPRRPNVQLYWNMGFRNIKDAEAFFTGPLDKMLYRDEAIVLEAVYRAIRDIAPGDEIFMDYGDDWQDAWDAHVEACGRATRSSNKKVDNDDTMETCMAKFRHEIGVPHGFFPPMWLAQQKHKWDQEKASATAMKEWDLVPVEPGEIRRVQVKSTGEEPMKHVFRIGLPPQLPEKMLDFAHRMGIVDILYDYVKDNGNPMEKDATERHRINGGTWWAKRFDAAWKSNMHYITPDDDKANADMLAALQDAGWHDVVLNAIGTKFELKGLMSYYMSFIAVTHCTGSAVHDDAAEGDEHFNCIFPLIQVPNSTQPELLLGADAPNHRDPYSSPMILPYNYEPTTAVCLGDGGLHSTGPIDYRGMPSSSSDGQLPNNWRLGLTIYIVDANNFTVHAISDDWHEPPYPYHYENFTRAEFFWKNAGRDWKATSSTASATAEEPMATMSSTTTTSTA